MRVFWGGMALLFAGCAGSTADSLPEAPPPSEPVVEAQALPEPPPGQWPTLVLGQAWFKTVNGRPVPQPARLVLLSTDGKSWFERHIDDPKSNVFHKAIPWRDGILTIGAEDARLVVWTPSGHEWSPKVLWEKSWGGKFDRLRDLEIGDVTGDGKDDLVIATHDQGVVAVGQEGADGTWSFIELDQTADTFVHEIEIGDVDGDGKNEFYATPSGRNRASGESQPGSVVRYDYVPGVDGAAGTFARKVIVEWTESHAKEILVNDVDGDGKPELYAVREGHVEKGPDGKPVIKDPVRIVRLAQDGSEPVIVATLENDKQCRFLVPADIDGDGKKELIAAGFKTGIWLLRRNEDGTFTPTSIDTDSSGFEHATHVADLDKDGKPEIYVAADDQHELRRYVWNGKTFDRTDIYPIAEQHITWNIQDGTL